MITSREIEKAIHQLPKEEKWDLLHRFSEGLWEDWDRQIAEDLSAGKLSGILAEARSDIAAGNTRSLDEVLNHG